MPVCVRACVRACVCVCVCVCVSVGEGVGGVYVFGRRPDFFVQQGLHPRLPVRGYGLVLAAVVDPVYVRSRLGELAARIGGLMRTGGSSVTGAILSCFMSNSVWAIALSHCIVH